MACPRTTRLGNTLSRVFADMGITAQLVVLPARTGGRGAVRGEEVKEEGGAGVWRWLGLLNSEGYSFCRLRTEAEALPLSLVPSLGLLSGHLPPPPGALPPDCAPPPFPVRLAAEAAHGCQASFRWLAVAVAGRASLLSEAEGVGFSSAGQI